KAGRRLRDRDAAGRGRDRALSRRQELAEHPSHGDGDREARREARIERRVGPRPPQPERNEVGHGRSHVGREQEPRPSAVTRRPCYHEASPGLAGAPMSNGIFTTPIPRNEPVLAYAPGSAERKALGVELRRMAAESIEIAPTIGGKKV